MPRVQIATRAVDDTSGDVSENSWQIAASVIFSGALLLRFVALSLNPLHHDEGVNGFFLLKLLRDGVYQYDPANYHGATLYYFTLPVIVFFDKFLPHSFSVFAVRFVPALFGLGTVALMFALRRRIGTLGVLTAAALIAVSPGNVYVSRYFIHETMFVFFTLGIVVGVLRFYETTSAIYLLLASASAALLFATKETAFISVGVLLIAFGMTHFFFRWREGEIAPRRVSAFANSDDEMFARFGGASRLFTLLLIAVAFFIVIYIIFYSSFFTHWKGVGDSLETFKIWTKTGTKDHTKSFHTYLLWLKDEEGGLFVLSILGAGVALWRSWFARDRFGLFVALWGFGLLAAYSLIAYKTPWLALNFILPLALAGGYGVDRLYKLVRRRARLRLAMLLLVFVSVGFGLYQSIVLNFYRYDDDRYAYVYAHTQRDFLQLINEVEKFTESRALKKDTPIAVDAPEYWPLPWYLRDYKGAAYIGRVSVGSNPEPLVIIAESQLKEFEAKYGAQYATIGAYNMRPGVVLMLYARRDLLPH
ncbi:MAG: hypothetical protein NVSMB56_07230 [Pyrinomonadaceae bacterium]